MIRDVFDVLCECLTDDTRQEIADKVSAVHAFIAGCDGCGLKGGMLTEDVIHDIFRDALGEDRFQRFHRCDQDMKILSHPISFKKISGKSSLALGWSKNPSSQPNAQFSCPILILNTREGRWWRRKQGFDDLVASGLYLVDPDFCNTQITLGTNNKTNTLISSTDVYRMLRHAVDRGMMIPIPAPRIGYFEYSVSRGFTRSETVCDIPAHDAHGFRFVDLFCGIGGFHQALSSLGGVCVFACDIDPECRKNYRENYGIEPAADIRAVAAESIPPHDVVCAGFPCQPFSKAGDQDGFRDKTKGTLFDEICRIISHHHPRFFILENVRNIVAHDGGRTWRIIRERLVGLGYTMPTDPVILSPHFFGTPQTRERAFMIGTYKSPLPDMHGLTARDPTPTDIRSILLPDNHQNRLSDKHSRAGEIWEGFCALLTTHRITIPRFPIWTDHWDSDLREGDPFHDKYRGWIDKNRRFFREHQPLLQPWLEASRKDPLWIGAVRKLEWQCNHTSLRQCLWTFRGSGLRVRGLEYSPTLVAMGMIPVYGPEWRYLDSRELCRLQDLPDTYKPHPHQRIFYKQIGNSVNVMVIRRIAATLLTRN